MGCPQCCEETLGRRIQNKLERSGMRNQGGNSYKSGRRETKEKEVYPNSPKVRVYPENSQSWALDTTKSTEELAWQGFRDKNRSMLKPKQ